MLHFPFRSPTADVSANEAEGDRAARASSHASGGTWTDDRRGEPRTSRSLPEVSKPQLKSHIMSCRAVPSAYAAASGDPWRQKGSELGQRAAGLLPTLPPHVVIHFFACGGPIAEVLAAAGLSRLQLARATRGLQSLRAEVLATTAFATHPPDPAAAHEDLMWGRPAQLCRRIGPEFSAYMQRLQTIDQSILKSIRDQRDAFAELSMLNQALLRTTDIKLGAKARSDLRKRHQKAVLNSQEIFDAMLIKARQRYRLIAEWTTALDRLLFAAGCPVREILASGGTRRTLRTVYNHTSQITPSAPGQFPTGLINTAKTCLATLSTDESCLINFRRSVECDLQILAHSETLASGDGSFAEGSWTSQYWIPY